MLEAWWPLPFTKLHGLGNSYIYVDARRRQYDEKDLADLARLVADPHFGIGADGLILILEGTTAPFRMRIFNADGSEAEMCGNGVRGFAKYLYDRGWAPESLTVETGAGLVRTQVTAVADRRAREVAVDMGQPRFERGRIPMVGDAAAQALEVPVPLEDGRSLTVSAVSMGNPHAVHFADTLWEPETMARIGPTIEHHAWFPHRVNFHVVHVVDPHRVEVRHWERGSGMTLACGTGAAAITAVGVATGRLQSPVTMDLPGGRLVATWEPGASVHIAGPTVEVVEGMFWPR
jgi:diaminopimelate epimerase